MVMHPPLGFSKRGSNIGAQISRELMCTDKTALKLIKNSHEF
jgi:hypothetical protein